jgi:hypothetical protein
MKATEADITEGIECLKGQGKTIRYCSSIVGPTRTAMSRRIQGNGSGARKTAYTDADGNVVMR